MAGESLAHFNRETALSFISSQTQKIVSAQVESADRIIVSQERVASGIDKVGVSVDRVADGLEGLASAFEWGFSEIVWHLEQERAVLKDILKVLQAPLDTQAKELRKRAEEAYKNGWIDDALKDFLESEKKNRYDFTVHHSLGNIYFFHKKIPEKALEHYEKAAKYATPKSSYHASLAFIHIGLVKYLQEDFQKAYESTIEAIKLYPKLYEAHYDCARYCACLGKYDEALDHLWEAIKGDRNYCLNSDYEKDFNVMQQQLHSFFSKLLTEAEKQAKGEIAIAQDLILDAVSYGLSISDSDKFRSGEKKQNEAKEFLRRGSLLDTWDSIDSALKTQELVLDASEGYLAGQRVHLEKEFAEKEKENEEKAEFRAKLLSLVITPTIIGIVAVTLGILINKTVGVCCGIAFLLIGSAPMFTQLRKSWRQYIFDNLIKRYRRNYKTKLAKIRVRFLRTQFRRELSKIKKGSEQVDVEDIRKLAETIQRDAEQHAKKHEYSKEQLHQLYNKLPKDLQKATFSDTVGRSIQDICTQNGVTSDNAIYQVARYTGYVLLGLLQPDEFQKALVEEVNLHKTTSEQIAREMNESIFLALKDNLEALYKIKML